MYRQSNARGDLSIEEGTANVPADGRYYVIDDGRVGKGYKSLRGAVAHYQRLRTSRPDGADEMLSDGARV